MYRDDPPYDLDYLSRCYWVAQSSPCNTKIGAVLVNPTVVSIFDGWNAPPYPVPPSDDCRAFCERACKVAMHKDSGYTDCPTVHAEMMALVRAGSLAVGSTLYVNGAPCRQCAKLIAFCRVAQLVCSSDPVMAEERRMADTVKYLEAAGVKVWLIDEKQTGAGTNGASNADESGTA